MILVQTQTPVNTAEQVYNQLVACFTAHFDRFPGLDWAESFRVWQQAWSDDRGIDLTQFPVPAAPLADVAINEDAALWYTAISTGIGQF